MRECDKDLAPAFPHFLTFAISHSLIPSFSHFLILIFPYSHISFEQSNNSPPNHGSGFGNYFAFS